MEKLVKNLDALLRSIILFKKQTDREGFSLEKISVLVPAILSLVKQLPELKGIKEDIKATFSDDDKIKSLVNESLILKNTIKELIEAFEDNKKLLQALEEQL